MTELYERLSRLHRSGHAHDALDLIHSPWSPADGEFRSSAVLAAITDRPTPGLFLIYRPDTMRSHPGHVALPGGKVDPGESIEEAALREAYEEMGIDPAAVRVIGQGDMFRTGNFFEINPVIGVVPGDIAITPNPDEVADWFEAPLDHVLNPANHTLEPYEIGGQTLHVWTIDWNGHRIWGATAMILMNISRRLGWTGAPRG
jgi:8-oxo-dGTP pyrophosphatase MutT (NUDIX family)